MIVSVTPSIVEALAPPFYILGISASSLMTMRFREIGTVPSPVVAVLLLMVNQDWDLHCAFLDILVELPGDLILSHVSCFS